MKPRLLDANVLLALGIQHHSQNAAAVRWFDGRWGKPWATCPFVECGFIRIGANLKRTPGAGNIAGVHRAMTDLRKAPKHHFFADDFSPLEIPFLAKLQGHQQLTDAYLLQLAVRHDAVLATFDSGIKTMARDLLRDADRVELIPA
ncbi:MAG: TA system VapC family ribonuclease toxin [Panacagrimonas sp.]